MAVLWLFLATNATNPRGDASLNLNTYICWFVSVAQKDTSVLECEPKAVLTCDRVAEFFDQGTSVTSNDWQCRPAPTLVAACAKPFKRYTRSVMPGLQVGMPELVAPFTKFYSASIKLPGHTRAKVSSAVVVTGDRYMSDQERVALPQSQPLMVVHDPPGGTSFASFTNARVEVSYKSWESQKDVYQHLTSEVMKEFGPKAKTETPIPKAVAAGGGFGAEVNANVVGIHIEGGFGLGLASDTEEMLASNIEKGGALQSSLKVTFTYSTSGHPDQAGPAADAFLVPAVWLEIWKIWRVSFAGSPACLILGEMQTTLVANPELNGFAFTTANDIETRTLPLLTEQKESIKFLRGCALGESCCRTDPAHGIDDAAMGCVQSFNLAHYCAWKNAGAADLVTKCINFDAGKEKHKNDDITTAAEDWFHILDRNYKHHQKARNMKSGQKNEPVAYARGGNVVLDQVKNNGKLVPLAPQILTANARALQGREDSIVATREEMATWNMVEFAGGGSAMEFETNSFSEKNGLKDVSTHFEQDAECPPDALKTANKGTSSAGHMSTCTCLNSRWLHVCRRRRRATSSVRARVRARARPCAPRCC